jgi:hypothetical protein
MPVNSFRRLLVFGALYCASQGALDSWDEAYELSYLSAVGVSVSSIALAQSLGVVPMMVKSALALPSDVLRLRAPFIAIGLALSGAMFLLKVTFNPAEKLWAYVLLLILRNAGAAVSDAAADGLAIDADVEALSGTLSAWQGVGRMAGLMASTAVGGALADGSAGFLGVLLFLGAWMLASVPVAGMIKEELAPSPAGARAVAAATRVGRAVTCGLWPRKAAAAAAGGGGAAPPAPAAVVSPNPLRAAAGDGGALSPATSSSAGEPGSPMPLLALPGPPPAAEPLGRRGRVAGLLAAAANSSAGDGGEPSGAATGGDGGANFADASRAVGSAAALTDRRARVAGVLLLDGSGPSPPVQTPTAPATPSGKPPAGPEPPPPSAPVSTWAAARDLAAHVRRTPVAPVVLWLQQARGFSVSDVGNLTVVGALGNMAGCYFTGVGFDVIPVKRAALLGAALAAGLPYLAFAVATSKPAAFAAWTAASFGYGALYTVQVSQMRLLADRGVAAAYSGLCMGTLAAAAAVGTYVGGVIAESGGGTGEAYERCYTAGAATAAAACLFVPWITAEDPEVVALKARQRAERAKAAGGRLRRRSSFAGWVARVRGADAAAAVVGEDAAAAAAAAVGTSRSGDVPAKGDALDAARRASAARQPRPTGAEARRTLRRPALGSMRNLLDAPAGEAAGSVVGRARRAVRGLFDDGAAAVGAAVRRLSRTLSGRRAGGAGTMDWGTSGAGGGVRGAGAGTVGDDDDGDVGDEPVWRVEVEEGSGGPAL